LLIPELPEVETTCRGITPHLVNRKVLSVELRCRRLRQPVTGDLVAGVQGAIVLAVRRRAKYLLVETDRGTMILHLGMTGHLHIVDGTTAPGKHDHVDFLLDNGRTLRFNDSRRFGLVLWTTEPPHQHKLLVRLGPEPFAPEFTAVYMKERAGGTVRSVKSFIMDQSVVVGIGNIYACESLYRAGINPHCQAGRLSLQRWERLVSHIRLVLEEAITAGGTTIRDFLQTDGRPGYFYQSLQVYGKRGEPCPACGRAIKMKKTAGRSTFYCTFCQR